MLWDPILNVFFVEFHTCGSRKQYKGSPFFSKTQEHTFNVRSKCTLNVLFCFFLPPPLPCSLISMCTHLFIKVLTDNYKKVVNLFVSANFRMFLPLKELSKFIEMLSLCVCVLSYSLFLLQNYMGTLCGYVSFQKT